MGRHLNAVEVFDHWVEAHVDPKEKRAELLGNKNMSEAELQPIREMWREKLLNKPEIDV